MRYKKIAMTSASKTKIINDFLETVGLKNSAVPSESIYNEMVSAMYSVMNAGGLDRDEIEQMLNLYLMGLNPSDYWTRGSVEGEGKTDKAQAFLSAFSDRILTAWQQLWGNKSFTDKSEEAREITKTFKRLKLSLRQRAFDEMRALIKEKRNEVSIDGDGGGDDESAQAYQNAMQGEVSRSVSVGETFNLRSWDEIKAAGNRDQKVGKAVQEILELFSSNMLPLGKAIMELAFMDDRATDSFEHKLFQIGLSTGEFDVSVQTFADSLIKINQDVSVAQPNALRSANWARNLTKHLIVTAYPELRHLVVPEIKGGTVKSQKLPENIRDVLGQKHSRPFSNALISLPKTIAFRKAEIFNNKDATFLVSQLKPNQKVKVSGGTVDGIVSKDGVVACTPKVFEKLIGAATTALTQKWVRGKRARQSGYWQRGLDYVAIDIEIDQDTNPLTWITADPVPSAASSQTKNFIDSFQGDLTAILMDLNEAHGWYELRNKRMAKKKEAKLHRLASKIAFRWIQQNIKGS